MRRRDTAGLLGLGALVPLLLVLSASSTAAPLPGAPPAPAASSSTGDPATAAPRDESLWPADSEAWLVLRTGIREGAAFRTASVILERGRWIPADIGYYDSGDSGEYRLFWVGAGGAPVDRRRLRLELKAAFASSSGTATPGERHLLSNAYLSARPGERWKLEVSHTEALPLNTVAVHRRTLDRARLEYEIGSYQLGVGYAGSQSGRNPWQHRPFVSVSRAVAGFGEIELWLQRVERFDGATERLQLRFSRKLAP